MTCETIHYRNHTESYPLKVAKKLFSNSSCLQVQYTLTLIILLTDFNTLVLTLGNLVKYSFSIHDISVDIV